jgi:hypothetical protein
MTHSRERVTIKVAVVGDIREYTYAAVSEARLSIGDELHIVVLQPLPLREVKWFAIDFSVLCNKVSGPYPIVT